MILSAVVDSQEKGIIGTYQEDGFPVVLKFVNELPDQELRQQYGWLTVISWKYDGSERNGMPPEETNEQMIALEHAIDESIQMKGLFKHAYSRTGNDLKELVYYISDRDVFIKHFNSALAEHPRYPIEINFYEDRTWRDFQTILERFGKAE